MILLALLGFAFAQDEETFTLRLSGPSLRCEECRSELEGILKKSAGFRAARFEETSVRVEFDEASRVPDLGRLPRALGLGPATLQIRGTVSFHEERATFLAKGSHQPFLLVNPDGAAPPEPIATLRKQASGRNRFRITGSLKGERTLVLASSESVDWKEK